MLPTIILVTLLSTVAAASNAAVPTGCVEIKSNHNNQFLAVGSKQHSKYRQYTVTSHHPHLWTIEKEGDHYLIWDRRKPNELDAVQEAPWDIERLANGKFLIRSNHLQEYLYAADYPNKGLVFTWRVKDHKVRGDEQFHWYINPC
ncbi:hypothetical protein pipiens_009502 [Culex pipiens pipiens]|uniref:Uncharacterized protein n=1 Tax=Culex pipiens pipiens TaxID=38569 RepID=A0ABD1DDL0_CULPP